MLFNIFGNSAKDTNPYAGYKINTGSMTPANCIKAGYLPLTVGATVSGTIWENNNAASMVMRVYFAFTDTTTSRGINALSSFSSGMQCWVSQDIHIDIMSQLDITLDRLKELTSIYGRTDVEGGLTAPTPSVSIVKWLEPLKNSGGGV